MNARRTRRGVTLLEMLIVVTLLAVLAAVVVPSLSTLDDQRLDAAASEVRQALRFARAEALRLDRSVLLDASSTPGHLKVFLSSCYGSGSSATDPRTKRAFDVDIEGGAFTRGVSVTPRFLVSSGSAYDGLVFADTGVPTEVCRISDTTAMGTPQAGSQVLLTLGTRQLAVSVDPATGRIWGP